MAFDVPSTAPAVGVEYVALGAATPAAVRYQRKLEGLDEAWSAPTDRTSVEFGRPAAGSYRLLIRAVSPSGVVLANPVVVPFSVLRPIWAQWWFVSVSVLSFGSLLQAFHRARVARAVAVERVRLRIARDLHDELGSNLSRIAILGEVAQRDPSRVPAVLADVSQTARRLVDTLGEVVWLVDPRKDNLVSIIDLVVPRLPTSS